MSRPFVYETPGPSQSHSGGSRRRQPGQVRLRRYLVTEVVTEVADLAAPSGQPVEPADKASPADSDTNNWFRPEGDPPR